MDDYVQRILLQGDSTSATRAIREVGEALLTAKAKPLHPIVIEGIGPIPLNW